MKDPQELAEELHDKYSMIVGDSLSDFEYVNGRDVVLENDFKTAIVTACEQSKADTIEKVERAISELMSKILHLEDRGNDFFVMGAFVELTDKIKQL
jgi:hypothetical protein